MMRRITLIAIILFIIITGSILIGSSFSNKTKSAIPLNSNLPNKDINLDKYIKRAPKTKNKALNKTNNNLNGHINSPDIDIAKLNFDLNNNFKDTFTLDKVASHHTKNDCYLIINNKVYDVSSYMDYHPAGSRIIIPYCGKEVTGIFASIHSNRAWDLLKRYKIGTISTNKLDTTPYILKAISEALKKANPQAKIVKVSPKNKFYVAKIIYNGKLYETHINNQGKIFKEEIENDESDWSLWEDDSDDK